MRDKWYADNRDLVKWGVLLSLVERYSAKHILQVAYYRPTDWRQLGIDGSPVELPEAVLRHFRDVRAASDIETPATIEVLTDLFRDRREYQRIVLERIRGRSTKPSIVFLDPDTGLESRHPTLDHVLNREVQELWAELDVGDVLVFYQHQTNRNGQPWIEEKKTQFERAIGLPIGAARVARAEAIARDVVFFYAQRAG